MLYCYIYANPKSQNLNSRPKFSSNKKNQWNQPSSGHTQLMKKGHMQRLTITPPQIPGLDDTWGFWAWRFLGNIFWTIFRDIFVGIGKYVPLNFVKVHKHVMLAAQ